MARLLSLRIHIAGDWRDIWLYKQRILAWDRLGTLHYIETELAVKHLAKNYGASVALLAQTLIFRNDWKVGEQTRMTLAIPDMEAAFLRPFKDSEQVVVDLPRELFKPNFSEAYSKPVLDTFIYADRVYLGTSDGLLESYINSKHPDRTYYLEQQHPARVTKLAVKYAAINAAAEDEGLLFGRVKFADQSDSPGFLEADFRRVADYSVSVSHAARNILNYTDAPVPDLYRAKVEKAEANPSRRFDEHQVTGYHDPSDISVLARDAIAHGSSPINTAVRNGLEVHVLGNSNYSLLAAVDGRVRVVDLRAFEGKAIEVRRSHSFKQAENTSIDVSEILETHPIAGGFIIELPHSLQLINREGTFGVIEGEVARVRTFASSIRHKEAFIAIQEDSASIVGFHIAENVLF